MTKEEKPAIKVVKEEEYGAIPEAVTEKVEPEGVIRGRGPEKIREKREVGEGVIEVPGRVGEVERPGLREHIEGRRELSVQSIPDRRRGLPDY